MSIYKSNNINIVDIRMIRFNKNFTLVKRFFGGHKIDPSLLVKPEKEINTEIAEKQHLSYLSQDDKSYLYEQSRVRKTFALYNIMRALPNSVTNFLSSFVADPKVTIKSDSLYLPRLSKNGVPVFDSLYYPRMLILVRSIQIFVPLYFLFHLHFPGPMIISTAIAYLGLYRPTMSALAKGFVVKMQLVPETEQLLVQKIGAFGCMKTFRIKTNDLEIYDKSKLNLLLYRFSRSFIDSNLIFRVKSTGELLFFDPQGVWYEEGLNHELLI